MPNQHPVILVHGLFGWGPSELGGFPYWGTGTLVPSPLCRRWASVGPISSVHDRACELAFQIRGGQVDYGGTHAIETGHARFGRVYSAAQALHPIWSGERPVHLVGHSMGGPTICMLQRLLSVDHFGWGSNADWICSISSISGVLNGSTATYFLGCDAQTGLIGPHTVAEFLGNAVELSTAITGDVFDRFYDFDLDHWGLKRQPNEPLRKYLDRIADLPMFRGKDNGAYSLTIQGALEQNADAVTNPGTYYFSYVTTQTFRGPLTGRYLPAPQMNPFMIPTSLYQGSKIFAQPFYVGFQSSDWWPNDGLVSTYSQMYPRIGTTAPAEPLTSRASFQPGTWYYEVCDDVDHIDIIALPQLNQVGMQKRFYVDLFNRLAAL
jgi:triacylglycerol lipase